MHFDVNAEQLLDAVENPHAPVIGPRVDIEVTVEHKKDDAQTKKYDLRVVHFAPRRSDVDGSPLSAALDSMDMRIKIAAAIALAKMNPKNAFVGHTKVMPIIG